MGSGEPSSLIESVASEAVVTNGSPVNCAVVKKSKALAVVWNNQFGTVCVGRG